MTPAPATAAAPSEQLAARLRGVCVGLRHDLDASRHVFLGEVSYILRDPLTFQSHRFSNADYQILTRIEASNTLGATFSRLVDDGLLTADDEERFYAFIFRLHQLALLNLPVSDDKALYRRFRARRQAQTRRHALSLLFFQAPLWNPSAFLDRTIGWAQPLFSRGFLLLWLLVVLAAGAVCTLRWHDLARPLDELLATQNIAIMWITLIALKVCHEFGHAYACRRFGGHVPEMGAIFILGTPCAYMDASSSWGFPSRWQRIAVALAGMYVELFIAAIAVFVWALASDATLRAVAYNIMFLAGITTLLFNANPLMKYDGYYVLSDLAGIPNLRARSLQALHDALKRSVVGVHVPATGRPALQTALAAFGAAAAGYRVFVMVGIAALLAMKLGALGAVLAAGLLGVALIRQLLALGRYLLFAEETAGTRVRAGAVAVAALLVLPVAVLGFPVGWPVYAPAVAERGGEVTLRAPSSAFLEAIAVRVGDRVTAGASLATLSNADLLEAGEEAQARLLAGRMRLAALEVDSPWEAQRERSAVLALAATHQRYLAAARELEVIAPIDGQVLHAVSPTQRGRFLERGEAIATLGDGGWLIRCLLNQSQLAATQARPGDLVEFRCRGNGGAAMRAEVVRVEPAGRRALDALSSSHVGQDGIGVDEHGEAAQPYFEVRARLLPSDVQPPGRGATGMVRFPVRASEPLGLHAYRAVSRFVDSLSAQ